MSLHHLGINIQDPDAFAAFLEACFNMRTTHRPGRITLLEDDAGFVLALAASADAPVYPPDFHLGFYVDGHALETIHARLADRGLEPTPIESIHGNRKFFVQALEGILIEVSLRENQALR